MTINTETNYKPHPKYQTVYYYLGFKYNNIAACFSIVITRLMLVHKVSRVQWSLRQTLFWSFSLLYTCVEESGGGWPRKTPSLKLLAKLVW